MNARVRKGLIVAALHVAIVAGVAAKFQVDRATQPRVWTRTAPVDPNLPIRGRYVRLQIEAAVGDGLVLPGGQSHTNADGTTWTAPAPSVPVRLSVQNDRLVATPGDAASVRGRGMLRDGQRVVVLEQPLAYFIPEHVADPSIRPPGEELWVEVTIPRRGLPRPIQLGVKKDGVLAPLDVQ